MPSATAATPKIVVPKPQFPDVRVEKLPNETTIVMVPQPGAKTMDIRIANLVGSWSEPQGKEGLAHLMEHLWFNGTPTRSEQDINATWNAMGDARNAYTELGETVLFGTVNNRDAVKAAKLMTDMYANPSTNPREVQQERRAVEHEIRMKTSDTAALAQREVYRLLHGDDAVGNDGWGTVKSLESIKPSDVKEWAQQHLTGRNTVAFVAGDPSKFPLTALRKGLSELPKGRTTPEPEVREYQKGAKAVIAPTTNDPQANLAIALPTEAASSPAGMLATAMLKNQLNDRLRGSQHMTYGIWGDEVYQAPFSLGTELHPRDVRAGVKTIAQTIRRLPENIDAKELAATKQRELARIQQQWADPKTGTEAAFGMALEREFKPEGGPAQFAKAIAGVTLADARAAARELAKSLPDMKIAASGNVKNAWADIRGGLKDAKVDVKIQRAKFDEQAWRRANELPPDPRKAPKSARPAHAHKH